MNVETVPLYLAPEAVDFVDPIAPLRIRGTFSDCDHYHVHMRRANWSADTIPYGTFRYRPRLDVLVAQSLRISWQSCNLVSGISFAIYSLATPGTRFT